MSWAVFAAPKVSLKVASASCESGRASAGPAFRILVSIDGMAITRVGKPRQYRVEPCGGTPRSAEALPSTTAWLGSLAETLAQ
jgi:hypothetical protein